MIWFSGRFALVGFIGFSLVLTLEARALAVPGDLDTSFSGDGKATTNFTSGDDWAWDMAIQADGKIVASGAAQGSGGRFALVRYNPDGSLDASFSGDGKLTTNFTSGWDTATSVAIQADGKIVAAGSAANDERFAVTRYNTDGSMDTSFSGDGKVTTNFTSGYDWAWDVAIETDGNIVAAGAAGGSGGRFGVARYNTDGSPDTSFSGDGKAITNFTSGWDTATSVAFQTDGKIVAAGEAAGSGGRFAVARYNTDGSLDNSFSGDGKVTTNFTSQDDWAWDVAIQSDGNIVAAGTGQGSGGRFALARYNADGSLDTSFSGDGKITTDFTSSWDIASAVAIQGDGKIVAAGSGGGSGGRFTVARFNMDGSLDTSFSGDGKVTTDFTAGNDGATDAAIQADGKIVAAGWADGANERFAVARYEDDGAAAAGRAAGAQVTERVRVRGHSQIPDLEQPSTSSSSQ